MGDGLMGHEIEKAAMPSAFAIMRHEGFIGLRGLPPNGGGSPRRFARATGKAGPDAAATHTPPAGEREQRNRSKGFTRVSAWKGCSTCTAAMRDR